MLFSSPLIRGILLKRYKRFLADIRLENQEIITAHCANPGSMLSLLEIGARVYVSKVTSNEAKLAYRWELIELNTSANLTSKALNHNLEAKPTLVGVNTFSANKIIKAALDRALIPELVAYTTVLAEQRFSNNTRFDFFLENNQHKAFLEVKSVHLKRQNSLAEFPDAKTLRGQKHLDELVNAQKLGYHSYLLFLVQRADCTSFSIAEDIDTRYATKLKNALQNNVKILCYSCSVSLTGITLEKPIPIII